MQMTDILQDRTDRFNNREIHRHKTGQYRLTFIMHRQTRPGRQTDKAGQTDTRPGRQTDKAEQTGTRPRRQIDKAGQTDKQGGAGRNKAGQRDRQGRAETDRQGRTLQTGADWLMTK